MALSTCGKTIQDSLKEQKMGCDQEVSVGECSDKEINRLIDIGITKQSISIIAAGGGKVLDTGKAVAYEMKIPVIIVPTIAATDAPARLCRHLLGRWGFRPLLGAAQKSGLRAGGQRHRGTSAGSFSRVRNGRCPGHVLGGGYLCQKLQTKCLNGACPPTLSAIALARLCYDTLLEHGLMAKLAVEQKSVAPSVEAIVEANTLLSGLGFESGGLAGSHAVHNGFTVLEASHGKLHGQKVAFGTLTQLVLEGRPSKTFKKSWILCQRRAAGLFGRRGRFHSQPRRNQASRRSHDRRRRNHTCHLVSGNRRHG